MGMGANQCESLVGTDENADFHARVLHGVMTMLYAQNGATRDDSELRELAKKLFILAVAVEMDMLRGTNKCISLRGIRKWFHLDNLVDMLFNAYHTGRISIDTETYRKSFLTCINGVYVDNGISGCVTIHDRNVAEAHFHRICAGTGQALDALYEISGLTSKGHYSESYLRVIEDKKN